MLKEHPGLNCPGETDFLLDHIAQDQSHPSGWRYNLEALAKDRIFLERELNLPAGLDGRDLFDDLISQLVSKTEGRLVLTIHRNASKLAKISPGAPVLHLLRDPRDVAGSSIGMGWAGNTYYGVDHWIDTEAGWDRAGLTNTHEVAFEGLMQATEAELSRVCEFIGLSYDPQMLDFPQNSTYGPPDPRIAQSWKRKLKLNEVALIEGKVGGLLAARGYTAAATPTVPNPAKRALLWVENRVNRWKFNIKRYGLPLFLSGHVAKFVPIASIRERFGPDKKLSSRSRESKQGFSNNADSGKYCSI